MKRTYFTIIFITIIGAFFSCRNDDTHISVRLNSTDNIRGISFQKNFGEIVYINKKDFTLTDLGEFTSSSIKVEHSFESNGEGTCYVCVHTTTDTICTELYVEKGYQIEMNFKNDTLSVEKFF